MPFAVRSSRMETKHSPLILDLAPGFYVLMAAALLLVPIRWLLSWIIAAAVHELCHYIMVLLVGGKVQGLCISGLGARMRAVIGSNWKEVFCVAAGPVGGLLLLFTARWTPRLALCGLVQSVYNLIPVYPLDGGRIVSGVLERVFPRYHKGITAGVDTASVCILTTVCVYLMVVWKLGVLPLILLVSILLQKRIIKIPCKAGRLRVQ